MIYDATPTSFKGDHWLNVYSPGLPGPDGQKCQITHQNMPNMLQQANGCQF